MGGAIQLQGGLRGGWRCVQSEGRPTSRWWVCPCPAGLSPRGSLLPHEGANPTDSWLLAGPSPTPGVPGALSPFWMTQARGLLRLSRMEPGEDLALLPQVPSLENSLGLQMVSGHSCTGGHPGPLDSAVRAGARAGFRGVRLSEQGLPRKQALEEASELTRRPLGPSALVTMTPAAKAGSWLAPSRPMRACG